MAFAMFFNNTVLPGLGWSHNHAALALPMGANNGFACSGYRAWCSVLVFRSGRVALSIQTHNRSRISSVVLPFYVFNLLQGKILFALFWRADGATNGIAQFLVLNFLSAVAIHRYHQGWPNSCNRLSAKTVTILHDFQSSFASHHAIKVAWFVAASQFAPGSSRSRFVFLLLWLIFGFDSGLGSG